MTTSPDQSMSKYKSGVNPESTAPHMKSDIFSEGGDGNTGMSGQASKRG